MSVATEVLTRWNAGAARDAIVAFVERTVAEGVPIEERVAVFDNDGTLWCEKPRRRRTRIRLHRRCGESTDPRRTTRMDRHQCAQRIRGGLGITPARGRFGRELRRRRDAPARLRR